MNNNHSIDKIKQGDIASFNLLYLEYYKELCYHSFLIVNRKDIAEEVVQNIFVKIWEKRETLNLPENISSYLYRAVLNESLNCKKKQKRDVYFESEAYNLENISSRNEMEVDHHEVRKKIRHAIKKLPNKTRRVFIMNRKLNLSYQDIATRLNIGVKGVEYHICNALKLLRENLGSNLFLFFLIFSTMVLATFNVISVKVSL
jgi:RNA polymerase sigma-70 factor (ECF subfamily)